jgi:beta-N-acetylhexosaminidase
VADTARATDAALVLELTRRRASTATIVVCMAALIAACEASHRPPAQSLAAETQRDDPSPSARASAASGLSPVSLQSLTASQLAGQRIIYAYAGASPPASLLARIRHGEAAGVIFFGPNISSRGQLRSVIRQLQRANASSPVRAPLLMMTDQEGGQVRRLPGAPEASEKQLGRSENALTDAREAGRATGRNLAGVGVDVNLAPVLDVARHAGNFIDQYERSYGANPLLDADLGESFIEGQQGVGIAATAKHFPGLGAATRQQNTDEGPVVLNLSLRQLRTTDELPYESAIRAGVGLIMLSWAIYPALDASLPAGLSPTIIQRELRQHLGFRGVTVTDSLGAGALNEFGRVAQRGSLAATAGADLILCSARSVRENTANIGTAVLHRLAAEFASDPLSRSAAESEVARVIALRRHP